MERKEFKNADLVAETMLKLATITARSEEVPNIQSLHNKKLVDWYMQSGRGESLVKELTQYPWPLSDERTKWVLQHLMGVVFEDIAYPYLSSQIKPDEVLLSPGSTFDFISSQYEGKYNQFPFGFTTMHGLSVPDGLIIRNNKIVAFCEYTISNNKSYLEKDEKVKARDRIRFEMDMPNLCNNPDVLYVVPNTSDLRGGLESEHGHTCSVPITTREIYKVGYHLLMEAGMRMSLPRLLT